MVWKWRTHQVNFKDDIIIKGDFSKVIYSDFLALQYKILLRAGKRFIIIIIILREVYLTPTAPPCPSRSWHTIHQNQNFSSSAFFTMAQIAYSEHFPYRLCDIKTFIFVNSKCNYIKGRREGGVTKCRRWDYNAPYSWRGSCRILSEIMLLLCIL